MTLNTKGHETLLDLKFTGHTIQTSSGAEVFTYYRPSPDLNRTPHPLPLLVLLHGFPQNATMYASFIDEIPIGWDIMIPDLPGYGNSKKAPSADGTSVAHSKRELGKDILEVVDVLFGNLRQFVVYGHDRGARVAYSMTVNYPERVVGLAVLDIVPTSFVWDHMRLENGLHEETHRSHHWVFLSSPSPLPETLIASNPDWYYRFCMNSWMGGTAQNQPAPWIDDSIAPYLDEAQGRDRIKAACEDYRAGATIDIQHDAAANIIPGKPPVSESAPIQVPLLVLYSEGLGRRFDVKTIWASLSQPKLLTVAQVETLATCGHFVINEAQKETGKLTQGWLEKHWKDL